MSSSFRSAFAALLLASARAPLAAAVDVTVALNYSTYIGTAQTGGTGVTEWLGLRYAAPPVGELRFRRPEDPPSVAASQAANKRGLACVATDKPSNDTTTSEDCLFLDVYAPSNATASSRLPVFFFIQGGGFNVNATPNLNGTGLINASGNNIIVVTINYRVGPYGFLTDGDSLTSNNGLYDQRKALQWVQKYIAQFGGDPNHVVIGGASAGAASVSLHLTAFGGRDDGLFHGAAAESISFHPVYTVNETRFQLDNLAIRLGCVGSSSDAVAACMRSKTTAEIQDVNYNIALPGAADKPLYMYNPMIDGGLIQTSTYTAFEEGNFIKVPLISGDDTNGGTKFVPSNTSSLAQSNMFIKNQFPATSLADFATISALYPNPNATGCPGVGCYWRQASDVYGEQRYMCPTLYVAAQAAAAHGAVPQSWAYRWNVEDPADMAAGLGVPHAIEITAIFGPQYVNVGVPPSYYPGQENAAAVDVVQAYWTSFIRSYDPNMYRLAGSAEWEVWSDSTKPRLLFDTGGVTSMEDVAGTDLETRCEFWYSIGKAIKQ